MNSSQIYIVCIHNCRYTVLIDDRPVFCFFFFSLLSMWTTKLSWWLRSIADPAATIDSVTIIWNGRLWFLFAGRPFSPLPPSICTHRIKNRRKKRNVILLYPLLCDGGNQRHCHLPTVRQCRDSARVHDRATCSDSEIS